MIEFNKDTEADLAAPRYAIHDDEQPTQKGTELAKHLNGIPTGRESLIGVYNSGFNSNTNEWNEAVYNAMEKLAIIQESATKVSNGLCEARTGL